MPRSEKKDVGVMAPKGLIGPSAESLVDHPDMDEEAIQVLDEDDSDLEVDGSLDLVGFSRILGNRQ